MRYLIVLLLLVTACSSDPASKTASGSDVDLGLDTGRDAGDVHDLSDLDVDDLSDLQADTHDDDAVNMCALESYGAPGPFEVMNETTGPGGSFRLDRPVDPPPLGGYPAIVFSVGTGGSPQLYEELLQHFASYGFVVISGDSGNQGDGTQALEGIHWLVGESQDETSEYAGLIDPTRIAASGHSQGGNSAIYVAIKDPMIATVVTLAAGKGQLGGVGPADDSLLTQPVLYLCGSEDTIVPPQWCDERFTAAPSPAWKLVVTGANHNGPRLNSGQYWNVATMWLLARLSDACGPLDAFEGDEFALQNLEGVEDVERK